MLNLDLATIIFQIVNFLAFSALLYYLLFRPVMTAVRERAAEKERQKEKIAAEQEQVEKQQQELKRQLAEADQKADQILAEAREEAESEHREILEQAREEAERIIAEAHTEAHQMRRQAVKEFHQDLLETILDISRQTMARVAPEEVHDKLLAQLNDRIWELGRSEIERVEAFRVSLGERTPTAYVTTAKDLSPEQQGELARTLTALADRNVDLEVRTDPDLAAGLRVRVEDLVIDNSIAGQLKELREDVSETLEERTRHE